MYKVKSTYKVLGKKEFFKASAEEWIHWAIEMMEAGYDTEHLVQLAGTSGNKN